MKTTGVSCETKFGLLVFLGHPTVHLGDGPQVQDAFPGLSRHHVQHPGQHRAWGSRARQSLQKSSKFHLVPKIPIFQYLILSPISQYSILSPSGGISFLGDLAPTCLPSPVPRGVCCIFYSCPCPFFRLWPGRYIQNQLLEVPYHQWPIVIDHCKKNCQPLPLFSIH